MADTAIATRPAVELIDAPGGQPPQVWLGGAEQMRQDVARYEEIRAIVKDYIARNQVAGVDFGSIPMPGRETKPSLFKPGAEKVCMLLQLRAEFEPDHATLAMAGNGTGTFAYICRLLDRFGRVVGEGRGASNLAEKRGWTVNNAIKVCEKRAQVDAVLRVVSLSEVFTQDIEDMQAGETDGGEGQQGQQRQRTKPTPVQQNRQEQPRQERQVQRQADDPRARLLDVVGKILKRLTDDGLTPAEWNSLVLAISGGKKPDDLDVAGLSKLANQLGMNARTPADARKYIGEHSAPALAQQPRPATVQQQPPAATPRAQSAAKLIGHLKHVLPDAEKRKLFIEVMAGGELTMLNDQELEDLAEWSLTVASEKDALAAMDRRQVLNDIEDHLYKMLPGKGDHYDHVMRTLAADPQPSVLPIERLKELLIAVRQELPNEQKALAYLARITPAQRRPTP